MKNLNRFVSALLEPYSLNSGTLATDEVVFEPKSVLKLVSDSGGELKNSYKFSLEVTGQTEIAELLETVLSDWIDFLFLPSPQLFAIYADHDEYVTFYTPDRKSLLTLVKRLQTAGFQDIHGYSRGSAGKKWR